MSFAADMDRFIEHYKNNADKLVSYIVLAVGNEVVLRSPVGNPSLWKTKYPPAGYVGGRFRANWMFGVDSIDYTTTEQIDPSGGSSIDRFSGDVKAGHIHYISNSLPYAQRLEDGWSSQAPAGMVGLTAMNFKNYVDGALQTI